MKKILLLLVSCTLFGATTTPTFPSWGQRRPSPLQEWQQQEQQQEQQRQQRQQEWQQMWEQR